MIELSVVMPCLNEAETLAICIEKAKTSISGMAIEAEIIVSDNGSTDGSQDIAKLHGAKVVDVIEKGYGNALKGGIEASRGTYIIMADADDSYDFSDLEPFVSKLREGYDLVMGNRFKGGVEKNAMPFLHKYLGNPVLSFLGRLFFGIKIRDFHCGLRGFSKKAYNMMDLRTTGMEFASEMVVKSKLKGLKITEVPTTLSVDGRSRPPHLNTWSDGWRHLRFLLLYSPNWLFLLPGIVLMLFGTLGFLFIGAKPTDINGITLDVHSLLYASAFILIGFQFVVFYGLTKIFAVENGLLPKSSRYANLFKFLNLERGLLLGLLILIIGISLSVNAYLEWQDVAFGNLNTTETLRIVIPAVMSLQLGVQIILFSFFFSILGLKNKD
ncbi:glycosyltransferase family 2 protein [Winogradskyella maritima]|uniref:Glycosyltransferase family 2 protein n=1 Tax=Winogradskyella maritima TaxID=1517766 RepID=A0ABV8AH49_9FLAO|nr:glycosyltransferase family 2 protein [Winogradskyella maritima]